MANRTELEGDELVELVTPIRNLTHGVLKPRAAALVQLDVQPGGKPLLVVATGPYVGEGFDCPTLDALSLAAPLAHKGRLVQYAGRILRPTPERTLPRSTTITTSLPELSPLPWPNGTPAMPALAFLIHGASASESGHLAFRESL